MAEPALHFSLPFVVLTFIGVPITYCFLISAIAVVPDLDVLFKVHRSVSHSLIIYVPIVIFGVLIRTINPILSNVSFLVWLSFLSHIMMDLVEGYCPLFWPFSKEEFSIMFELNIKLDRSLHIIPSFGIRKRTFQAEQLNDTKILAITGEGILISLIFLISSLLKFLH